MVPREMLTTDRLNLLIWRYLLEGDYRETAAKFQKEWHVKEPHRDLPFAQHVKGHALVSIINGGLVYEAIQREYARSQLPQDAAADENALQLGVFGPLEVQPPARFEEEDEDAEGDEVEVSRKRVQHQLPNGSPAKRQRLSNGYENGAGAATATTPMDVDDHQDNHAYPSPLEGEQATTPIVRTDGPEQGTQVDKVEELSHDTTFIRLVDDAHASDSSSATSPAGAESAPILLQCEWNPRDPSILAAAGTDALARVWTVPESGQDHVSPQVHSLVDPKTPKSTTVTALSWTSDGSTIAVATDCGSQAAIKVCSANGEHVLSIEVPEPPVVKLSWNPSNKALLAISPSKGGALVTVYSMNGAPPLSHFMAGHDIGASPLDSAWTGDSEFLLCGGDLLVCLQCTDSAITQIKALETKEDDSFTQVLFDWRSKLVATSSDKGALDLWDESGQRKSISAHQGAITAMAWQSLPPSHTAVDNERLIATGGDDCAILLWDACHPDSRAKCFFTMDSPIVRLAFTPDGAFIAGATSSQVLIWKVGSNTTPRASWSRPPHPGWLSPKTASESDEEDEHCLSWDANGQRLAYGSNSRLAIIKFAKPVASAE